MFNTSNLTNVSCPEKPETLTMEAMRYFITVCLAIIIVVSIIGNSMVCIAFKVNENLRTVSNYFILSLAVSDLITTIFVMPYDLELILHRRHWSHGETLCQFYTTVYLVSAPASTLNLLAVSIDRYRLIRDPFAYKRTTTPLLALGIITVIWMYSTIMAFLPLMGWKDGLPSENCTSSSSLCIFDIAFDYSIMMSVLNFVVPPLIMTAIYFKIFEIARSHIRRIHRLESVTGPASFMISSRRSSQVDSRAGSPMQLKRSYNSTHVYSTVPHDNHHNEHANGHANQKLAPERKHSTHETSDYPHETEDNVHECEKNAHVKVDTENAVIEYTNGRKNSTHETVDFVHVRTDIARMNNNEKRKSRRLSINSNSMLRKNVKAAKSLAIIVGTFFLCWYPHTIVSVIANACFRSKASCYDMPVYVSDLLLTIGFLNSMLNPFLYALHSKEYKRTYKRILRWN